MTIGMNVEKGDSYSCPQCGAGCFDLENCVECGYSPGSSEDIGYYFGEGINNHVEEIIQPTVLPFKLKESKADFHICHSDIHYFTSISYINKDGFQISFEKKPDKGGSKQKYSISGTYLVTDSKHISISLQNITLNKVGQKGFDREGLQNLNKILSYILSNKSWNTHIQDLVDQAA